MDAKGGARINVPSMVVVGHCWTCWRWRRLHSNEKVPVIMKS
jgi:hypothetical protein